MHSITREPRRVCYIRSIPEWYGHHVNDIFFRQEKWLFVPLNDLTPEEKICEYQKSTYFFISGYGNAQIAKEALHHGCTLVGPRCDVDSTLGAIEISGWDNTEAYMTLVATDFLKNRFLKKNILSKILIGCIKRFLYIKYVFRTVIEIYKLQGPKAVLKRIIAFSRKQFSN